MCGIYGILNHKAGELTLESVEKMGRALESRGPDDSSLYRDDVVMLGHNRLSIIDLSSNARQPMSNEDDSIWITFNGEIYNFHELKKDLRLSHQFKSQSDTEVILHLYEEFGEEAWSKLKGMFAFCLWDKKRRVSFLVRDHFGVKPLLYTELNGSLVFASQLKAILEVEGVETRYNHQALSNYLSYSYIPTPDTLIKNVWQIPAGYCLRIDSKGSHLKKYYQLCENVDDSSLSYSDHVECLREKLTTAMKMTLTSDVPVGLLLSGGIDSNIILKEMTSLCSYSVRTFTLGVKTRSYDESDYAKETATHFGSIHRQGFFNYLDGFDKKIEKLVQSLDQLNSIPGILMIHQFIEMASKDVKVALMGSGGDELFAGYPTYKANRLVPYFKLIPRSFREVLLNLSYRLPVGYKKYSLDYVLKRFLEGSRFSREKAHFWWRSIFTEEEKERLLLNAITQDVELDASYKYIERFREAEGTFEQRALYADFHLFLTDNALAQSDCLGMAHSLEIRPPFLYQDFVEYVMSIPYQYKLRTNQTKAILKDAYRNELTDKVVNRKKHGVVAPLGMIFKKELKSYIQGVFEREKIEETLPMFNPSVVQSILNDHFESREDNGFKIWNMLCLMKWHQTYIN